MPVPDPAWSWRLALHAMDLDTAGHDTAGSTTAADVSITDAGGYFTATDVEAALQELAKKDIGVAHHGSMGSTETFDALTGNHDGTLDAACTFTFTGATSGLMAEMALEIAVDSGGPYTVTWPGSVVWQGTAPTFNASTTYVILVRSRDGGTTWYGFPTGGSGSALTIKDEGSSLATAATSLDFVGAGVVASGTGAAKTITIAGSTGIGEILISDTPSTPLIFADLIQNEAQTDLVYADP
jgi:hypothetical protein